MPVRVLLLVDQGLPINIWARLGITRHDPSASLWLALGALGKSLHYFSRETNALTINDLFLYRYKNKYLVWISSLALLLAFFAAMVVQFIGGARIARNHDRDSLYSCVTYFCLNCWHLYILLVVSRAVVLTDTIQGTW